MVRRHHDRTKCDLWPYLSRSDARAGSAVQGEQCSVGGDIYCDCVADRYTDGSAYRDSVANGYAVSISNAIADIDANVGDANQYTHAANADGHIAADVYRNTCAHGDGYAYQDSDDCRDSNGVIHAAGYVPAGCSVTPMLGCDGVGCRPVGMDCFQMQIQSLLKKARQGARHSNEIEYGYALDML